MWRTCVAVILLLSFGACAAPGPVLRSNKHLQLSGKEGAEQDISACQDKAERAGLKSGVNRSGSIASGGVLGLIIGAAGGASAGLIGGGAGVVIGAAAGGGLGLIGGLAAGAYKPVDPDPAYADVVVRCLIGKGYEVSGWEWGGGSGGRHRTMLCAR
ncbi:MAG: hypothetical protein BVN29_19630 [Nitrospira sp. ST-bin5]|nr:MAG: hypothetical protein BVN29_19630 [Nitrospira sp. ST-bin5]